MHSFLLGDEAVKVLIVDCDVKNVHELGRALRKRGFTPLEATTFEEGKQLWMAEKPPALIADIRLGQFNGLQLLLRAKSDRPDVRAVIMCAFADKVLETETQRFGGAFLVKPFEPKDVLDALLASSPARLESFEERRTGDRRRTVIPDVLPDRRHVNRRSP